jgi:hypothetical protein
MILVSAIDVSPRLLMPGWNRSAGPSLPLTGGYEAGRQEILAENGGPLSFSSGHPRDLKP